MISKYNTYTTSEFLNDDSFLKWIKYGEEKDFCWTEWLASAPGNMIAFEKAAIQLKSMLSIQPIVYRATLVDEAFVDIMKQITGQDVKVIQLQKRYTFLKYAAAVLLPVVLAGLYYLFTPGGVTSENGFAGIQPTDHKRATLILSDGKTVVLAEKANDKFKESNGVQIENMNTSLLQYRATEGTAAQVTYNTIDVPKGGEYKVLLADGTEIWLNAQTRLKFPTVINSTGKREVYLESGEAYFKVAKNKLAPFFVHTKGMQVQVLGTSFNINTYKKNMQTTLVEGHVAVKTSTGKTVELLPNQQANLMNDNLSKATVDVDSFIGWKNGLIIFDDANLEEIMGILGRWYDYDISFKDEKLKQLRFSARLKKYNTIGDILDILEKTGGTGDLKKVSFKIKNREIYVDK